MGGALNSHGCGARMQSRRFGKGASRPCVPFGMNRTLAAARLAELAGQLARAPPVPDKSSALTCCIFGSEMLFYCPGGHTTHETSSCAAQAEVSLWPGTRARQCDGVAGPVAAPLSGDTNNNNNSDSAKQHSLSRQLAWYSVRLGRQSDRGQRTRGRRSLSWHQLARSPASHSTSPARHVSPARLDPQAVQPPAK